MKQLLAYKYRIYPTEEQQILLSKTFGCKRVIFNHYLNEQQERFKNKEKHLSHYDINKDITKLKESKEWLREVDSIALQMAAEDLSVACKPLTRLKIVWLSCSLHKHSMT
jgi:putative transposase